MARLGYTRYGVQGGDVGALIGPLIGRLAPDNVIGVHANGLLTLPTGDPSALGSLSEADRERLNRMKEWQNDQAAYMQLQGTRPQTIAASLHDSPAGQLAWIVEKFKEWTNPVFELPEEAVDRDRILTDVSIYWFTGTAGSSAHTYWERFHDPAMWAPKPRGTVPTGVAVFPTDLSIRPLAEQAHNIVHWSEFERGGHFAALEAPDLLTHDIRAFFASLS
jgi:pimeloyl-ACP methyl ester carboxylesterase